MDQLNKPGYVPGMQLFSTSSCTYSGSRYLQLPSYLRFIIIILLSFYPWRGMAQLPCTKDVKCDATVWNSGDWEKEIRSVVKIKADQTRTVKKNFSGVLLNNTSNDNTLYVLTAFHCIDYNSDGMLSQAEKDDVANWEFHFKYYAAFCGASTTTTPLVLNASHNATLVSAWSTSDFALIRLTETFNPCNSNYNLYFAGWDRRLNPWTTLPVKTVNLSHPEDNGAGQPMKVLVNSFGGTTKPVKDVDTMYWRVAGTNYGEAYPGSSGSALFNPDHRVVGQFDKSSIRTSCTYDRTDYNSFGRFDLSWEGGGTPATRLKDWLYPGFNNNPNAFMTLDGTEYTGGSGVGGTIYTCDNYDISIIPKSADRCCWEVRVTPVNNGCLQAITASALLNNTVVESQDLTAFYLDGITRVYTFCRKETQESNYDVRIRILGINHTVLCEQTFPDQECHTCPCETGYELTFRMENNVAAGHGPSQCCYTPVVRRISEQACDVYGAHAFRNGQFGMYSETPLMPNVGDSIELPVICIERGSRATEYVELYNSFLGPGEGRLPSCELSAPVIQCCACGYFVQVSDESSSDPQSCCFMINIKRTGGCAAKSIYLYDDKNNYRLAGSSSINPIEEEKIPLCVERSGLPKTFTLRMYDSFGIDPQNPPGPGMCAYPVELKKCSLDCCAGFVYERVGGNTGCTDLVIKRAPGYEECEIGSIIVWDLDNNVWVEYADSGRALAFPYTIRSINCCPPNSVGYWERHFRVDLFDVNGRPLNCGELITTPCGYHPAGKTGNTGMGEQAPARMLTKLSVVPNPARDEAKITYELGQAGVVNIEIRSSKGERIVNVEKTEDAGMHTHSQPTSGFAAGLYYVRVSSNGATKSMTFSVVK